MPHYTFQTLFEKFERCIYTNSQGYVCARYDKFDVQVVFQPIIVKRNDNLELYGYEGLTRASVEGKPVSPFDFFEFFSGNERAFVDWMTRALHLRNFAKFRAPETKLFINLDPQSYGDYDRFFESASLMAERLPMLKLTPQDIVCEIVEHAAASDELLVDIVKTLRQIGVKIAVDDFGSMSSDMERVFLIEPDIIKMDRGWFTKCSESKQVVGLFKNVVQQFQSLGIDVLGEGLETPQCLELCLDCDIQLFQGYLLGRPGQFSDAALCRHVDEFIEAPSQDAKCFGLKAS